MTSRQATRVALASLAALLSAACGATSGNGAGDRSGNTTGGTSSESCVAPYLDNRARGGLQRGDGPNLSPGDSLTIYGHWYTSTCDDTGGHATLEPLPPVRLTVRLPGAAVHDLGTFTPSGRQLGFTTTLRVPAGTPSGTAEVRDDRHPGATYRFHVGS